jgi:hypothetical protein
MWTQFWDMHSGGGRKEKWSRIYIEASIDEAEVIFYNRFGHNPNRVSCTCCGSDYSIDEYESLEQATAYHRGCKYTYMKDGKEVLESEAWIRGKGLQEGYWQGYIEEPDGNSFHEYMTLDEFEHENNVLIIRKDEITSDERLGDVPTQGFIWMD